MQGVSQPSGSVTLVFTDIEGSTRLLRELGTSGYREALAEHRRIVRAACGRYAGYEVDYEGDAFFYAFSSAKDAVSAVSEAMEALREGPISIRVGIHTGEPDLDPPKYVGMDVHTAARIMASAHGGQVVLSPSTASLLDGSLALTDLGEHRFKDLSAPERIYQLGERQFARLKTLHHTNLPVPQTPFLGREKELAEVVSLLARDEVRLLTLTGPGGTGKTRLAAQAAGALAERYPDGVYWVPLATIRDATLVSEAAAKAVESANGLVSHVRDKRLLLLFDNFEQVVDAAPEVSTVLAECPNAEVLVTSRELLHLSGEQEYRVPPFAIEEGVGFFAARARAVRPDFQADEAVREICDRLDGLPLALELAAARLTALSTTKILERLEQRLPLLTGGARDAPERQRTLRATIEWSYDLLAPEEQRVFALLSVFSGGCTLEAVEEVCETDLDTLQTLVEKSLVRFTNERYWMLETIREYARERLDGSSESANEASGRHAHWYRNLSEEYEPQLMGPAGVGWFARLEAELPNIRDAIGWGLAHDPLLAFALVVNTSHFLSLTGRTREHARLLDAVWIDDVPVELRKRGLKARTAAALVSIDTEAMRTYSEMRLELARATADLFQETNALNMLGTAAFYAGDMRAASRWYDESVRVARAADDASILGSTLKNVGRFERDNGNLARSRELLEESLALSRASNNEVDVSWTVKELGMTAIDEGAYERARDYLSEGFEISRRLGLAINLGDLVFAVARLATRTERPHDAAVLFGAAEAEDDRLGYEHTPAMTWWWATRDELVLALGEHEFESCLAEGRAIDLDAAVARSRRMLEIAL
jgi:predicted ATPase/class 3 adenylate cyclase